MVVLVVLALVAAWVTVALRPDVRLLGDGQASGLTQAGGPQRWVVPREGGRLVLRVRNEGPLPVQLALPAEPAPMPLGTVEGLRPGDRGPWRRQVTVAPGAEAEVSLVYALPRCFAMLPMTYANTAELRLWVGTLGLSTTRSLLLPVPVVVGGPGAAARRLLSHRRGEGDAVTARQG